MSRLRLRPSLSQLARDVAYGARTLRRTPAVTALAVVTFALGIGANAAIFSVVNGVLLRPPPFPHPEQLVRVYESLVDSPTWLGSVSVLNLRDWQAQSQTIEGFIAFQGGGRNLGNGPDAVRLSAVAMTANAFSLLRIPPLVGQRFSGDDDHSVVLSEALWRSHFGGDRGVVGRAIELDGTPYTVAGVMPASFEFPAGRVPPDVWVPFVPGVHDLESRGNHSLSVVARLRPGVSLPQATAEMKAIARRLELAYPDNQANRTVAVVGMQDAVVGNVKKPLLILLVAVGVVLLIACANVANLLLVRAAGRSREVAVRFALGASRGQVVRQFLVESLLLALTGALLGAALAVVGVQALTALGSRVLPIAGGIPLDWRVFLFLALVSVVCGLAFGLVPALRSSGGNVQVSLVGAGKMTSGVAHGRSRGALVVAQLALSLALLIGAGLLVRAFFAVSDTQTGLDPKVLVAHMTIPNGSYGGDSPQRADRLFFPLLQRIRALPGVRAAGMTSLVPVEDWGWNGGYWIDGRSKPLPGRSEMVELRGITPGYFTAMHIPVTRGRDFTEQDGVTGPRIALINEAFARREFNGQDPIGQRIRRGDDSASVFTIIGVVGNVRQGGLEQAPLPEMYFTYRDGYFLPSTIVVDGTIPAAALSAEIRDAVRGVAPDIPLYGVRTIDEVIGLYLAQRRLNAILLGVFAGIALVLAASGIYGAIAYGVAQRTREIGIRIALGAEQQRVVQMMLKQGLGLIAIGVALGLTGALVATQWLASQLYGVGARDPLTFVVVACALAGVAALAVYVPARRAARVDPMIALRSD